MMLIGRTKSKRSVSMVLRSFHSSRIAKYNEGDSPNPLFKDTEGRSKSHHSNKFRGEVNYFPDFIHSWTPERFKAVGAGLAAGSGGLVALMGTTHWISLSSFTFTAFYWYLGLSDLNQNRHTVRKNFPVLGRVRYLFEVLRPEIYQYFVESDQGGRPFNREQRSQAYQRAKNIDATMPFGTRKDVYEEGYEWINHSLWPKHVSLDQSRTLVGEKHCSKPYSAALLNVSAMSYGALSDRAILSLSRGASMGGFYHNTGEGGISKFHIEGGADIVWNIGTGYFGCRKKTGEFDVGMFRDNALKEQVKMIEIKLSQGAKPGHGGLLPKQKITPTIAEARGLGSPPYEDCNSPPSHSAFTTPTQLAEFIATLREESGGKPVGIKLCVGRPEEMAALVRGFVEVGGDAVPDFITVDGAEGGTGAAPPEFSNRLGSPLLEGLSIVNGLLIGANLRDTVRVIGSGRVVNGFDLVKILAIGADFCNSARAMMFALGCIQALQCNTNKCPTGIATTDTNLMRGLNVEDKSYRVFQYQAKTVHAALEIIGACGLENPSQMCPEHVMRRVNGTYSENLSFLLPKIQSGEFFDNSSSGGSSKEEMVWKRWWKDGGELMNRMEK